MADGVTIGADALKSIVPLLAGAAPKPDAPPPAPPMPPPGPPPPTPAQMGWQAFSADPQNQQRASHAVTEPGQSIIPPTLAAPPVWNGVPAGAPPPDPVPSMGNIQPMTAPPPAMGAPMPNVTQVQPPDQATWQAAHPDQVARPLIGRGAGVWGNVLQAATAGLTGAAGGLHGNPTAGLDYVQRLNDYDRGIPETNTARYRAAVVQPMEDAAKLADTQSQTSERNANANKRNAQADAVGDPTVLRAKQIADAAKRGNKPVYDASGNLTGEEEDPTSGITRKRNAAIELAGAQIESTKSQKELRDAQAALDKSKNDPKSPAYAQAQDRINVARQNASIAQQRFGLAQKQFELRSMGTVDGVQPAGGMQDDNGNAIGTAFQQNVRPTGIERNKGDMASSAADQIETMKGLIRKRQDIFGPAAGRKTDFDVWLGSQDPDAQRFRAARTIAADHLAGTFGGRSEPALKALDDAIGQFKDNPKAVEAGLDQLGKANSRFQVAGTVRTKGSKAAGSSPASTSAGVEEYVRVNGKLVKKGGS